MNSNHTDISAERLAEIEYRQSLGYFWDDATHSRTPQGHVVEADWFNNRRPASDYCRRIVRFDVCWGEVENPASFSTVEVAFDLLDGFSYKIAPQFYCSMTPEQMHAYFQILLDLEKWAQREAAYMLTVAPQTEETD